MDIYIDTEKTLQKFSDAEITIVGWCAARGFKRDRFYAVVNNRTLKYRTAIKARKIVEALKRDGLVVLVKGENSLGNHANQNISCSACGQLEQNNDHKHNRQGSCYENC